MLYLYNVLAFSEIPCNIFPTLDLFDGTNLVVKTGIAWFELRCYCLHLMQPSQK